MQTEFCIVDTCQGNHSDEYGYQMVLLFLPSQPRKEELICTTLDGCFKSPAETINYNEI